MDEEKRVGVADRAKKKEKGARTRRDGRHLTRATTLGLHNHRQNRWVWICGDVVGCGGMLELVSSIHEEETTVCWKQLKFKTTKEAMKIGRLSSRFVSIQHPPIPPVYNQ